MKRLLIMAVLLALCTSMAWAQSGTLEGVTLTVNAKENYFPDNDIMSAKQGYRYYAVDVTLSNHSGKTISYNVMYFTLQDDKSYTYTYTPGKDPFLNCGDLENGRSVRGWITFEVPVASKNYTLIWKTGLIEAKQLLFRL